MSFTRKLWNRFRRVFAWLRTVRFEREDSSKVDVVIFDLTNIDYLIPLCGDFKFFPLDVSGKVIPISLGIIKRMAQLLLKGSNIETAYYLALVQRLQPFIVMTFIDNSALFHNMAKYGHRACRFLAIQNASRFDVLELTSKRAKNIYIPEFACFGEHEKDMYTQKGIRVDKFYPVGSLRESYYRRYRDAHYKERQNGYDFDICVVAEASPGWDKSYPGFEDAIGKIAQYAVRLAREKGLRLVIAGKRDVLPHQERESVHSVDAENVWYQKYIGTETPITPRIRDKFSTFDLTFRSRISLAMVSTCLSEAASRGNRILFCNFSGNPLWNFCVDGIWSLKEDGYEVFSERVMEILALSDEEYKNKSSKMAHYVMNNSDQAPTYAFLEKLIAEGIMTGKSGILPL